MQSREKGSYQKMVSCFFLCPDADCSRINLYMCPNLKGSDYYYGNIVSEEFEEIQKKIENKIHNNNSHKEFWVDERKMCEDCEVKFFCTGACRAEINKCKDYELLPDTIINALNDGNRVLLINKFHFYRN